MPWVDSRTLELVPTLKLSWPHHIIHERPLALAHCQPAGESPAPALSFTWVRLNVQNLLDVLSCVLGNDEHSSIVLVF